jgi:3-polyprenyl-4-hydroxybenzoate decarboxylase
MRKFSINREKKNLEPSDEQIKRHKDFSRIHHDYERLTKRGKRPLFKDPKLYLLLVLLGIVMLLVFLENK